MCIIIIFLMFLPLIKMIQFNPHARLPKDSTSICRVAFIFAGGIRTFITPPVYESITHNLLNGFCPSNECLGDVFIRYSLSDNYHQLHGTSVTDSKGIFVKAKLLDSFSVKYAMHHFKTKNGKVFFQNVDIGSNEESMEMNVFTSKLSNRSSVFKNIYRDFDSRRFSMYFHRWSAYKMMLKEESERGLKYDWVVHARLDMAWGAPVQRVSLWPSNKIYVPDCWFSDVPDTFALIPRNYSDPYFSLDALYEIRSVPCLGGPNFNPQSVAEDELIRRGYNSTERELVRSELCMIKYTSSRTNENKVIGRWSEAGYSEEILRRKLDFFGLNYGNNKGAIGYTSFFTSIVREPILFMCARLNVVALIHLSSNTVNSGISPGCQAMEEYANRRMLASRDQGKQRCNNSLADWPNPFEQHQPRPEFADAATGQSVYSDCDIAHNTDNWNFMPFRMLLLPSLSYKKSPALCLSMFKPGQPLQGAGRLFDVENDLIAQRKQVDLLAEPCVDLLPKFDIPGGLRRSQIWRYSVGQLFHFFPHYGGLQRIVLRSADLHKKCLTVVSSSSMFSSKQLYSVVFQECAADVDHKQQSFLISVLIPVRAGQAQGQAEGQAQAQGVEYAEADTNNSVYFASAPVAAAADDPPLAVAIIKWYGNRKRDVAQVSASDLCLAVSRTKNNSSVGAMGEAVSSTSIAVQRCYSVDKSDYSKQPNIGLAIRKKGIFLLERTRIDSPKRRSE